MNHINCLGRLDHGSSDMLLAEKTLKIVRNRTELVCVSWA